MARLIPPTFGRRLGSEAEAVVAERLRRELPDDAVLLHSVGLVRHPTKRWAEADFVLICDEGVFCIEVKGGRVARTNGEWRFVDRFDNATTKHEGPFDQAGGAAGALFAWLDDAGVRRSDGSRFQVGYAVFLPDCELTIEAPDIDQVLLVDVRMRHLPAAEIVERLGSCWRRRKGGTPLTSEEVDRLCDAIRPDFEARLVGNLMVRHVEEEIVRLTGRQQRVLEGLAGNDRLIVKGAAGTGKSMLALNEAARLAASGRRVLFLCHTRALADALRTNCDPRVDVMTAWAFMRNVIERAGLQDDIPDATRDVLFEVHLPRLAARALGDAGGSRPYEAVVIDEGQDLLRGDFVEAVDCAFDGGFADGVWRLFQDPNQNIFGAPWSSSLERLETGRPARYELNENCRNTAEIVMHASALSGADVVASSEVHGPAVRTCERWKEHWTIRTLDLVRVLIAEGIGPNDIVVLALSNDDVDTLIGLAPDLFDRRPIPEFVRVSTVAGFKGLESPVALLAGLRSLDEEHLRQAAYIGTTRARALLGVVLPEEALDSLRMRWAEFGARVAENARQPSSADRRE